MGLPACVVVWSARPVVVVVLLIAPLRDFVGLDVNELLVLSSFFPSLCSLPHIMYNFVLNVTAYPPFK